MATKINIHQPTSFSEVLNLVEDFQDRHEIAWYRGCGRCSHNLKPTLYRHPTKNSIEELSELERELALVFDQRSPPFVTQNFKGPWDRLFFMQHYGIPTRLLDWTESPFVALYFALTSCPRDNQGSPADDATVWLLDPISWNRGALSDISYTGGVLDSGRQQVKSFGPDAELDERKNTPVMIFGTHNSPRIVAQRGMFALFGKSTEPMEEQYEKDKNFSKGNLEKIVLKRDYVDGIARSLFRKGISDSTIYPDLTGLSLELRRSFGF